MCGYRRRFDPDFHGHTVARWVNINPFADHEHDRTPHVNLSTPMPNTGTDATQTDGDLRLLFHRLNNQLGIILAQVELLEAKAIDDVNRTRAKQIVSSVLGAISTAREVRQRSKLAGV